MSHQPKPYLYGAELEALVEDAEYGVRILRNDHMGCLIRIPGGRIEQYERLPDGRHERIDRLADGTIKNHGASFIRAHAAIARAAWRFRLAYRIEHDGTITPPPGAGRLTPEVVR